MNLIFNYLKSKLTCILGMLINKINKRLSVQKRLNRPEKLVDNLQLNSDSVAIIQLFSSSGFHPKFKKLDRRFWKI